MSDETTTIGSLRMVVHQFVNAREWQPFHAPKNISMAMAIEAAELMEHFQWLTTDASQAVQDDPEKLADVCDELADVFCYTLAMANALQIDLSAALQKKMAKNELKYPVDEFRGRYGPEDPA